MKLALNDTTGLLAPPVTVAPGLSGFGISLADFNADSNLDLVTSTDAGGTIDVLTGDGTGTFGAPLLLATAQEQQTQVAADLNGDGLADIAGVNAPATTVFLNAAAPTITGVSPAKGPVAGGTTLTLTGTGFLPGTTVTIGGKPALEVTVVSGATITLRTPQASAGPVDIVVTRTDGRSVTKAGAFTYELPPIPPPPPPPSPPPTTAPPTPTPSPTLREQLPIKPLNLPKRLKNVGVTRIVKVPVRTNAGQNASVRVTGVARQLQGEVRVFRVFRRDAAVWVKLSGTQGMRVRVRVHADAMPGFTAYTAKKVYVTKAVR